MAILIAERATCREASRGAAINTSGASSALALRTSQLPESVRSRASIGLGEPKQTVTKAVGDEDG